MLFWDILQLLLGFRDVINETRNSEIHKSDLSIRFIVQINLPIQIL